MLTYIIRCWHVSNVNLFDEVLTCLYCQLISSGINLPGGQENKWKESNKAAVYKTRSDRHRSAGSARGNDLPRTFQRLSTNGPLHAEGRRWERLPAYSKFLSWFDSFVGFEHQVHLVCISVIEWQTSKVAYTWVNCSLNTFDKHACQTFWYTNNTPSGFVELCRHTNSSLNRFVEHYTLCTLVYLQSNLLHKCFCMIVM